MGSSRLLNWLRNLEATQRTIAIFEQLLVGSGAPQECRLFGGGGRWAAGSNLFPAHRNLRAGLERLCAFCTRWTALSAPCSRTRAGNCGAKIFCVVQKRLMQLRPTKIENPLWAILTHTAQTQFLIKITVWMLWMVWLLWMRWTLWM